MTLYLEMFHEHGDDDVDQHELSHQDEHDEEQTAHPGAAPRRQHDEEDGRNDGVDAAVAHAVRRLITVLAQRVLPPRK